MTAPEIWRAIQFMSSMASIVGDIGGTNARFALAGPDGRDYTHERAYAGADFQSLEAAIEHYLIDVGLTGASTICLAVAGPIVGGAVQFTNSPWRIAEGPLKARFATERVRLINDFEAVAWALPLLADDTLHPVGKIGAPDSSGGRARAPDLTGNDFTIAVLGPGTGLGAAGLVRRNGITTPLITEAGHVGFAPETIEQGQLLARLQERFERVSDERLASGAGLENIHSAINPKQDGVRRAAEIFELARSGDPRAVRSVDLFFEVLGQVAGNLALSLGAFQGVYIAGGVAQRHLDLLAASRFRSGFENKGRHRGIMAAIPTFAITHPQPGLLGASHVAKELLT